MSAQPYPTNGGAGVSGLLTGAFIVLKLCHVIKWSWLWVLAPTWIPFAAVFAFFIIFIVVAVAREFGR